jgi:hypothetical protein
VLQAYRALRGPLALRVYRALKVLQEFKDLMVPLA